MIVEEINNLNRALVNFFLIKHWFSTNFKFYIQNCYPILTLVLIKYMRFYDILISLYNSLYFFCISYLSTEY